jgi:hypothetical protein
MMVILEMLSRATAMSASETYAERGEVDQEAVFQLAVEAYRLALGMRTLDETSEVMVAKVAEIPEERKIIQVEDLSIGVFHHKGGWYAVHNAACTAAVRSPRAAWKAIP